MIGGAATALPDSEASFERKQEALCLHQQVMSPQQLSVVCLPYWCQYHAEHQSVIGLCTFHLRAVHARAQHSGLVGSSSYNLFCILVTKTLTLTVLCENTADDVEHATSLKITLFSQLVPN